jgi:hypothetical protein
LLAAGVAGGLAFLPRDRLLRYELGEHGTHLGRYSRADVPFVKSSGGVSHPPASGLHLRPGSMVVVGNRNSKGMLAPQAILVVGYSLFYVNKADCYIFRWW